MTVRPNPLREVPRTAHFVVSSAEAIGASCTEEPLVLSLSIGPTEGERWHNITSAQAKQAVLSWVKEIPDKYHRARFVDAWHPYFVSAGEVVLQQGAKSDLVFAVGHGKFSVSATGKMQTSVAHPGEFLGFLTAWRRQPSRITVQAKAPGLLWAIEVSQIQAHDEAIPQFNISSLMTKLDLRRLVATQAKKSPVILVPGLMSSRLVAWKRKSCLGIDVQVMDQLWISVEKLVQTVVVDKNCYLDCLALHEDQSDPPDCKVRPMQGINSVSQLYEGLGITTIFK